MLTLWFVVIVWVWSLQLVRFAGCRSAADRHDPERHTYRSRELAGLRFHDQSTLDVVPNSSGRLNKFIYDPNRRAKAGFDKARGFRLSTGAQGGNRNYQVNRLRLAFAAEERESSILKAALISSSN